MIGDLPIVTFDTSAHNRLVEGDPCFEAAMEWINSSMWFRFAGLSVEELVACPGPKRESLLAACRRLQNGPSECLLPCGALTEQLILAHFSDPSTFDWKTVNVRWLDCEMAIRHSEIFTDEQISREQREFQTQRRMVGKQESDRKRESLRPEIQAIFEAHGEEPPSAFQVAVSRLANSDGSAVWFMAKQFYDRAAKTNTDEATAKEFMRVCPPFRALIYAMFIPWYNSAVRDYQSGEKLNAGINDLFMSVYLPYCDKFVTAEKKSQQEKCLREVASVAGLETEILSYDDFCDSFSVPGVRRTFAG